MAANTAQKSDAEKALADLQKQFDVLKAGLVGRDILKADAEGDVVAAALNELDVRGTEISAAEHEVATLKRQLAAQKGVATRARNEKLEAIAAYEPRQIGPLEDDVDGFTAEELLKAAEDAGTIQIAFSDGSSESAPPLELAGAYQLKQRGGALLLDVPSVIVHGPEPGKPNRRIAGFALLLDGEQVAWHQRFEPLVIGAGTQQQLAGDIRFAG